jgi:MtN3 and saliva related transmembrane protein
MEVVGFVGGAISVSAGVPQIIKCIKTGQTKDLSYITNVVSYIGSSVSIFYGVSIQHKAIVLINVYSMIVNSILLGTKLYCEKGQSRDSGQLLGVGRDLGGYTQV